jgi:hypothetical protein
MNVGAVESIALALAARPDLAEPAGTTASRMTSKAQEVHQTPRAPEAHHSSVTSGPHIDVYA